MPRRERAFDSGGFYLNGCLTVASSGNAYVFIFFEGGRQEGKVCWSPSHVPTKLPLTGAKAYVKNGKGAEL